MEEKRVQATCDSCQFIGVMYWYNGFTHTHHCLKSKERRKEEMHPSADFMAHFRAFFDAASGQTACRHYAVREISDTTTLDLLKRISDGDREFKFFSKENELATKLRGMFVVEDDSLRHYTSGDRAYQLLPVGKAELKRAQEARHD